ncbi:MAG: 2-oxoglutarate oxidoreductase [Planctomycetota bacterium]|nr:MAG: 2-oxoglutarate oxidoreductase [Planctomycetota bacterium]
MFGLKTDCILEAREKYYTLEDYQGAVARWCPGCGDHAVLTAIQKLCREQQLAPENTVFVSGIGCSSRFPHYMKTFGFHGLHGRALPVAEGIRFRRPDLNVFVITGDGDCCSIGAGHWVHSIRYNMNITVMLLDNEIYGMTKKQTSPTTQMGTKTNTHPYGSVLPPINPLSTALGMTNVSFVAQTIDWNPAHLYETIKRGFEHPGMAFIRILQRCPHFRKDLFEPMVTAYDEILLLRHEKGIPLDDQVAKIYKNQIEHNPEDIHKGRELADTEDKIPIGLFYCNPNRVRYDEYGSSNLGATIDQKIQLLEQEFDRYSV